MTAISTAPKDPAGSPLLETADLAMHFPVKQPGAFLQRYKMLKAVDGVSLTVGSGETLGLVGESGCGKSTVARLLVKLLEPTSGAIRFDGRDITRLSGADLRRERHNFQIVFQDPYSSLNPRMKVADLLAEPMVIAGTGRDEQRRRIAELLEMVGLNSYHASRYPHEFSGGQRQRIGIARALALRPKLVVCDEPVSALDVSVQAQIINLLRDLQQELKLSYLFIAHDLSVVRHISDRVAVMYLGKIVEIADKKTLFAQPKHPYTQVLMSAVPVPKPGSSRHRTILKGDLPSPIDPPGGCRFHTRCPYAFDKCRTVEPLLTENEPGHFAACHLVTDRIEPPAAS